VLLDGRVMVDGSFEGIVAAHHAEIHRYVRRVVSRRAEADDLSQETFLRAFRAHRSLPADANVRAWLFAIATNLCRNHFRSERRRRAAMQAASEEPRAADGDWPEGEAVFNEARGRLEEIIRCLPVKQRLAVTMRKLHDLDYDAIGESLDCSPESARAHVFQALRKIRRGLDGLAPPRGVPASGSSKPGAAGLPLHRDGQ
jgi:RNA polymerase sigma factor (sigma-70 family)